ncbi:MAG: hypothetical protein UR96_C0001G0017 [candidate division WS6 bacterium GW2011_GWC1_36_11]|uniref:Uncharacterized protein n=3 Tax=Candidatus Dojkabacteria TaxID=74243 RepID=A0A0G0DVY2_9BACT|nr:MAG: hypothetical protein UR96_C0001G0017 [candidate division WS6 bacterium GW2011_GWC1_36_11]KKQ04567.1 MAG: hypothetical protein US14_C0006G0010 [candidate division WS6 bacterium GW2011_WS6_36_26]KKQ10857.1 MAG: hypothetical protein US23_C0020G0004 [candidate division WS6 bacterium GW2011_GWE1_36_69]KKQ12007.1 MAG: hypothetical protein US24_C0007G0007 [candidate division WS6 bacterium GW2011_GWC2_36_7]KKQ15812.1 MAG: hypothetical protein US29_C0036G0005 [candidate division WS6 bacterium GW
MTPEALKIREYILSSAISDSAKNEILPLLGVIGTPGIKERILKILEIEGKAADLEEKFLNLDIDNPQGNTQQQVPVMAPAQQAPVAAPMQQNPAPVAQVPSMSMNAPVQQQVTPGMAVPASSQVNYDAQTINQLEDQLKQMR